MSFPKSLDKVAILDLLAHCLGGDPHAEDATDKLLKDRLKTVPAFLKFARSDDGAAGEDFLNLLRLDDALDGNSGVRFMELLQLLSNDAAVTHHDKRSDFDRPLREGTSREGTTNLAEDLKTDRFLQFWEDLREAFDGLRALERFGGSIGKNAILILDDNPEQEIRDFACSIAKHLFGSKEAIQFYNPLVKEGGRDDDGQSSSLSKEDDKLFQFFTSYQTLGSSLLHGRGDGANHGKFDPVVEGFRDLLKEWKPQYVLVDQLFKIPRRGRTEFLGPTFIRGLIRWLHDDPLFANENGQKRPEIIALSRTDDPRRIREAMRAGARAYIVKSRLVSLPSVLARVCLGTQDSQDSNARHRAFRALYDLGNETIGLLHNARLPRIAFHSTKKKVVEVEEENLTDSIKELWTEVLKRVPKTDLHVHAGSIMSREFLLLASLVMLASKWKRGVPDKEVPDKENRILLQELPKLARFFNSIIKKAPGKSKSNLILQPHDASTFVIGGGPLDLGSSKDLRGKDWIDRWGEAGKAKLKELLEKSDMDQSVMDQSVHRAFRASLHRCLGIPDHLKGDKAVSKLKEKDNLAVAFYLLRSTKRITGLRALPGFDFRAWRNEDLIRVYLLVLGSRYGKENENENEPAAIRYSEGDDYDFLEVFRLDGGCSAQAQKNWEKLYDSFWGDGEGHFNVEAFRQKGWNWPVPLQTSDVGNQAPTVHLPYDFVASHNNGSPCFRRDPIGYTLASGSRSTNLVEYLLGCEFSGAEHLRHPFLIHVYARMAVMDWVRNGVIYAELKASPDGYNNTVINFQFPSVCRCLIQALSQAQKEVLRCFGTVGNKLAEQGEVRQGKAQQEEVHGTDDRWPGDFLGKRYSSEQLVSLLATGRSHGDPKPSNEDPRLKPSDDPQDAGIRPTPARLPVKTSLIFVGKRHKSLREMILEAAGAAVLRPPGESPRGSAAEFVEHEFPACRVVGFDLAGPEDGNPPSKHAPEFGRLNRLHLPITVHAGENAGAQFIEDSILELGAKRIGHGLSLAEDDRLIARVRDDSIAIELCPVCNHQTSQFHEPGESNGETFGRPYPLKKFLEAGVIVTINTDNPITSNTDMVREFYQASYAYSREGLTLWEALRLVRMGFVSAFLNLSERRHLIEIAEQWIFDQLSSRKERETLRRLAAESIRIKGEAP